MSSETQIIVQEVKKDAGWLTFAGFLMVSVGFLALAAPLQAGIAVATLAGFMIMFAGIFRAVLGFKAQSWGGTILSLLVGVAMLLCGLVILARPLLGLASITLIMAIYFFIEGVLESILAFELRPMKGWVWTLIGGVVTLLLGVMIWRQWPLSGAWAVGTLLGIHLIFAGWAQIALGSAAKAVASEVGDAA